MNRAGYVLAGGQGRRMGCDKALLRRGGETLVAQVAGQVREAAGNVTLVGRAEAIPDLDAPVIPDLYPGQGPLGGLLSALSHSTAEWNLVVACDMPGLTAAFLRTLFEAAEGQGGHALIPADSGGRSQPLCAVYRRTAHPPLAAIFAAGERRLRAAVASAAFPLYPCSLNQQFQNVNTPQDWARYAE